MPQLLTSPLSTPTGMPVTNQAHLGKLAGTRIHFGTFADFTAAITTGTAFYAADLWADGQEMTIASEADAGAVHIWRTSLGHARTVRVGRVDTILLANSNVVLAAAGQPVGGTGNNGDLSVDRAAGVVYLKTAGAWAAAGNINLISNATATAIEAAKAAGADFLPVLVGTYANTGALPAASAANIGRIASVGGAAPYALYKSNGSAWVAELTPAAAAGIQANSLWAPVSTGADDTLIVQAAIDAASALFAGGGGESHAEFPGEHLHGGRADAAPECALRVR